MPRNAVGAEGLRLAAGLAGVVPGVVPRVVPRVVWVFALALGLGLAPGVGLEARAAAPADPCPDTATTQDRLVCRLQQIEAAEQSMARYLDAARGRAAELGVPVQRLADEQAAWGQYRTLLCGNVYRRWAAGSIRYEKAAQCNLQLVRRRTQDLWRAYLTPADASPPVLPDPGP